MVYADFASRYRGVVLFVRSFGHPSLNLPLNATFTLYLVYTFIWIYTITCISKSFKSNFTYYKLTVFLLTIYHRLTLLFVFWLFNRLNIEHVISSWAHTPGTTSLVERPTNSLLVRSRSRFLMGCSTYESFPIVQKHTRLKWTITLRGKDAGKNPFSWEK